MKIRNCILLINVALGTLMALAPFKLFPVCTAMAKDGNPMKCYYTGWLLVGLGVFIATDSLFALMVRRSKILVSCSLIMTTLAATASWIIPKGLIKLGDRAALGWECGLCGNLAMGCHTATMPVLTKIVIALVVLNVLTLLWSIVCDKQ